MAGQWLTPAPDKYGGSLAAMGQVTGTDSAAQVSVAPTIIPRFAGITQADSPMFAFAALSALAVGLMAYSSAHVA